MEISAQICLVITEIYGNLIEKLLVSWYFDEIIEYTIFISDLVS